MFRNYLLTTYRNLVKTKLFSLVNILGLAIGMTACLLIMHYVHFERSYDSFHENSDRIYRLRYERTDQSGDAARFASCCPPAAARIRGQYPEVEKIARILNFQASVSYEDLKFREERVYFAEPQFLEILKFPLLQGDRLNGIAEPNTAFVSRSTAQRYFGNDDPIGKVLSVDKKTDYQITGIFEDIPQNSHLKFDILLPWKNLEAMMGPDYYEAWGHTGSYTYLIAAPGTDPAAFEQRLMPLIESECPWLKEYNMTIGLKMQPLTDIHLNSHFMQEYEVNGNSDSVDFLFIIAFFIIIMAWVNYVNLSTARSLKRAKEVGLRKVVGASRSQLIIQFFFEVTVINLIAVAAAIGLLELSLPLFNQMTGITMDINLLAQAWLWLTIGGMFLVGVFLSGLYPVLAMSGFKPITALKGRMVTKARGINLRQALVVFQFAVGLFLIIATLTVYRQLSFMRGQELGFDMNQTLVVRAPRVRDEKYISKSEAFRETLLKRKDIEKLCHVTEVPGRQVYWDAGGIFKAGEDANQRKNYQIVGTDYDFADVFGLEFVAGRNFSRDFPADSIALILNETAVRSLGFANPDSAVVGQVNYWGEIYPVVGVLKDYHQQSLKEAFEPHIFRLMPNGRGARGMIAMKVNSSDIGTTVEQVKQLYDEFYPGNPFDYFFLDEYYNQQYQADELFGKVYSLFSFLAIFVTALGIYGLSAYSITQMTREIGIRKVLGASITSIVKMLTREFVLLAVIANAIAWPIAWYAMSRWLERFAWRTEIGIAVFMAAGLLIIGIALLTVSYQVIRAARANPVNAIQHE
jgi:putative ABC transport system permease protein